MTEEEKKTIRYSKMRTTMLERHGADFYKRIGSTGGKNGDNRPFRNKDLALKAAKISAEVRKRK